MNESDDEKPNPPSGSNCTRKTVSEARQSSNDKGEKSSDIGGSVNNDPLEIEHVQNNNPEPQANDHGLPNVGNEGVNAENGDDHNIDLYKKVWRAMQLFIDVTSHQPLNINSGIKRYTVSD